MRFFKPRYEVQLHVVDDNGEVAFSWEPLRFRNRREAERMLAEYRRDNRWGMPGRWPKATLKEIR